MTALVGMLRCQSCGATMAFIGEGATWIVECRSKGCRLEGISWVPPTVPLGIADPSVVEIAKKADAQRMQRISEEIAASFADDFALLGKFIDGTKDA